MRSRFFYTVYSMDRHASSRVIPGGATASPETIAGLDVQ